MPDHTAMKILLFIPLLLFYALPHGANAQDTIHWRKDYQLSWPDFKGSPANNTSHKASTSSGISYSYTLHDSAYAFTAIAFFDSNKSWSKTNDSNLLVHEQGHFDITQIYARRLQAALSKLTESTTIDEKKISTTSQKIIAEKNTFQRKYDLETGYGSNQTKQRQWTELIQSQLSE